MVIQAYYRPKSLDEALRLLDQKSPRAIPLGGGTGISNQGIDEPIVVVDLQDLNLNRLEKRAGRLEIGATTKLQSLADWNQTPQFLRDAILKDANANQRNMATVGGTLIRITGKSRIGIVMLAVDCQLTWEPGGVVVSLGNWLAAQRTLEQLKLITSVHFAMPDKVSLEEVTQAPGGFPIISVCLAEWSSGRKRLVVADAGSLPKCILDGKGDENFLNAINAHSHYTNKCFSSRYLKEMLQTLTLRITGQEK